MPGMQAAEAAYNVPYKVGDAIRYLTTPSTTFAELTEDLDPESAFVDIMPRVVSDPAQSGAVKTDAARLADYNLNAGYGEEPFVSGAKTSLDETLLGLGLSDTDPREKVQQDVLGARLGGDPTGSYNLGDVSGIGSVEAAKKLLTDIPQVTPERDEEGKIIGLGEGVSPLQVELAKNIRAAEQPGRSYAELIEKVKASRARDYGEGTAAAAALRAESEAEQERLKKVAAQPCLMP
jgi:hypothetical protein